MIDYKFTVLLEPAEEGGFVVKSLELPVTTQGETKEEALNNIKEAIESYLDCLVRNGFRSEYSMDDFRRGVTLLEKKLKQPKQTPKT